MTLAEHTDTTEVDRAEEQTQPIHVLLALGLIVAGLFGAYKLVQAVDPGHVSPKADAGFMDLVIGDRTVLTMVRIGVIFGLVYAVWSVVMLMRNGRHLTGIPGVTVSELREVGEGAVQEQRALEQALDEANENIEFLVAYIDDLQKALKNEHDGADDTDDEP